MSWQIVVHHEGLGTYRVVRGETESDAELKARLQLAVWNERWETRQSVRQAREAKLRKALELQNKKTVAAERTSEIQEQIQALSEILKTGVNRPVFTWDWLKDHKSFMIPRPKRPTLIEYSTEPDAALFAPRIEWVDRLFSGKRKKKEAEAAKKLEIANTTWRSECAAVDETNQKAKAEHQRQLVVWEGGRDEHKAAQLKQHSEIDAMASEYRAGDPSAVEFFCSEILSQSSYSQNFPQECNTSFDSANGNLILDYELPDKTTLPNLKEVKYVASRDQIQEVPVSEAWLNRTYDDVLYQTALRSLHELFSADTFAVLRSIVFNGWVHSIDRATGVETHGCILSIQANREEFLQINLIQVDPKACFRKLKGVASSKLAELTPIRPIAMLHKEDHRFVEAYSVVDDIDSRTNLASMDWGRFRKLDSRTIREGVFKEWWRGKDHTGEPRWWC